VLVRRRAAPSTRKLGTLWDLGWAREARWLCGTQVGHRSHSDGSQKTAHALAAEPRAGFGRPVLAYSTQDTFDTLKQKTWSAKRDWANHCRAASPSIDSCGRDFGRQTSLSGCHRDRFWLDGGKKQVPSLGNIPQSVDIF